MTYGVGGRAPLDSRDMLRKTVMLLLALLWACDSQGRCLLTGELCACKCSVLGTGPLSGASLILPLGVTLPLGEALTLGDAHTCVLLNRRPAQ